MQSVLHGTIKVPFYLLFKGFTKFIPQKSILMTVAYSRIDSLEKDFVFLDWESLADIASCRWTICGYWFFVVCCICSENRRWMINKGSRPFTLSSAYPWIWRPSSTGINRIGSYSWSWSSQGTGTPHPCKDSISFMKPKMCLPAALCWFPIL